MFRWLRAAALGALLMTVQACGSKPDKDAASAAQGLLAAAATGDARTFESHLDRPAIRADLREQLLGVARARGLVVDGGPSDFALDRMIAPEALHVVQAGTGAPLTAGPSAAQTALILKKVDGRRVCIHDLTPAQNCVLTLAQGPAGWRLIGMLAAGLKIEVPSEPAK